MEIRLARRGDEAAILALIGAIAEYEKLADEVVASEELLREWLFEKNIAQVYLATLSEDEARGIAADFGADFGVNFGAAGGAGAGFGANFSAAGGANSNLTSNLNLDETATANAAPNASLRESVASVAIPRHCANTKNSSNSNLNAANTNGGKPNLTSNSNLDGANENGTSSNLTSNSNLNEITAENTNGANLNLAQNGATATSPAKTAIHNANPATNATPAATAAATAQATPAAPDPATTATHNATPAATPIPPQFLRSADGEIIAGYALFFYNFSTFLSRGGIYLEDLFVFPQFRAKGYGKALLRQLARRALADGCGRIEWCCLNWNTPSIEFYLGLGARRMSEWNTYRLTHEQIAALANS